MHNILSKSVLPKLEVFQGQWLILCIAAGVITIAVLVLVLILLRRRRSKKGYSANPAEGEEPSDKWPEENYEFITGRIRQVEKKYKSILFASVEVGSLPITIPVNVAIGLAKSEKRCFLIDLDLKRDAITEVFELDAQKDGLRPKAVRTEFENLWVWPGHNFAQLKQMNIKALVQKALDKFDFILINAPSLVSNPDRRQIISSAQAAFICTKSTSEAAKLAELMKPLDCMIIGHIQVPL